MNILAHFRSTGVQRRLLSWLMLMCLGLVPHSHADTLISTTTLYYVGPSIQTYTVPSGANYVVIKVC